MSAAPNPYQPTEVTAPASPARRSPILTVIATILGLVAIGVAALVFLDTSSVAKRQGMDNAVKTGFGVAAVLCLFACTWFAAAYFSWQRRRRLAMTLTLVALAIFLPMMLLVMV